VQRSEIYNKYYQKKLEEGLEYQDFCTDKLFELGINVNVYSSKKYQFSKGESKTGIEFKLDNQFKRTGNLYIEYSEKANPNNENYICSGIERKDNTWLHIQGNYEVIYIFAKNWLQGIKKTKVRHVTTPTSKGYLLPELLARKYAIKIIEC
jgi:hypothetical protein